MLFSSQLRSLCLGHGFPYQTYSKSYRVCKGTHVHCLWSERRLNIELLFHVVDGLCPDIMHDVLEGILAYEMKLLLQFCIRAGYFSLHLLNSRMKVFTYGPADARDKPAQISATTLFSSDNKLKQSGKLHF